MANTDPLSRSSLRVRLHGGCHHEGLNERMWLNVPEILFPTACVGQDTKKSMSNSSKEEVQAKAVKRISVHIDPIDPFVLGRAGRSKAHARCGLGGPGGGEKTMTGAVIVSLTCFSCRITQAARGLSTLVAGRQGAGISHGWCECLAHGRRAGRTRAESEKEVSWPPIF